MRWFRRRAHTDRTVTTTNRGGYPSPGTPITKLPKVPAGPAPGAKPAPRKT